MGRASVFISSSTGCWPKLASTADRSALNAVLTTPDGATTTVYANFLGQDMLIDLAEGSSHWISYNRYHAVYGRPELQAMPLAVDMSSDPYDEGEADLDVQLKANGGLIQVTTYSISSVQRKVMPRLSVIAAQRIEVGPGRLNMLALMSALSEASCGRSKRFRSWSYA